MDLTRTALLAMAALAIGSVLNTFRSTPISWAYQSRDQRLHAAVSAITGTVDPANKSAPISTAKSFEIIDLEQFQSFATTGEGIVIDARAASFYRQGHVPGALNLPREMFATEYGLKKTRLAASQTKEIVVYCSEADCPDAEMVANALAQLGFEHLRVYREGWEEWVKAGLPQEATSAP